MLTRRSVCRSLGLGGLSTLTGVGIGRATAAANDALAMQAAWVNDAEFMGYFVGLQTGLYKANHVDLKYLSGGPDVIPESALLAGKADLALTSPDTTIRAIVSQGAKFKIIAAQFQKNAIGVVSLASNPIKTVKALEGKVLAVPPVNMAGVLGMLKLNGIAKSSPVSIRSDAAHQGRDRRVGGFRHRRPVHDRACRQTGRLVSTL
jgi:ABC-type nitrate/sulfonate/bicarbonate transport system substrate-binding protein